MKTFEGKLVSEKPIKIGIVCARFNEFIVSKLLGGALDALSRHNIKDDDITVAWSTWCF
nr:6,7-dimethyl-8-ribityllumazine synthase [Brachyspira hyodysenteriae]